MGLSVCVCVALLSLAPFVLAGDPDPLGDYCVANTATGLFLNGFPCKDPAKVVSADFKSDLIGTAGNVTNALGIALSIAAGGTFPALNTQGLTLVRIDFAKGGFVPPHIHPRASEVLFVIEGAQLVGFVDTNGKLFTTTVYAGEIFVFPRGLVHYQLNVATTPGLSVSSLNSQSPGLSLVASALFGSTPAVPDFILEKTFQLTEQDVERIKKAFH